MNRTDSSAQDSRSPLSRRSALFAGAAAAGGSSLAAGLNAFAEEKGNAEAPAPAPGQWPLCVFNKPLQHLGYEEQAALVAEMGFTGIEGTVRKGGHVEPEKVGKQLPEQVAALEKHGLSMTMMTTDVNEVRSPEHRRVLETAAGLGVKRFRMGGIHYAKDRPLREQLGEIRGTFREVAEFCGPLGLQALYQNHSGPWRFGAGLWDLQEVLADHDPERVAAAFDIRHAVVEGGLSWPTDFQLIRPKIGVVYCKDFVWDEDSPKPRNVPMGTGRVNFPLFFKMLRRSGWEGPVSLHMEYKDHRDPALQEESIAAVRADREALVSAMK